MKGKAVNPAILKRLLSYGLSDKPKLAIAIGFLFIASLADVAGPWLIQHFIDNHIAKDDYPIEVMVSLGLGYVALMVIAAIFQYLQSIRFNDIAIGVVQTVRKQVFGRILNQPLSAFDYMPTGRLISRITNDTESIKDFYIFVISTVVKNVALISVMLVVMSMLSWRLTLVVLVLLPVVAGVMVVYQRKSADAYRRMRDLLSDINSSMSESIQGMSLIQLMRQEREFSQQFAKLNEQHLAAQVSVTKLNGLLLRPLIDLLSGIALISLVAVFGVSGTELVGVGVLYAFISYLGRVTEPLIELTQQLSLLQQALVASERIFGFIDAKQQAYGDDEQPLTTGAIQCQQVNFSYDGKQPILSNIDIDLPHRGFLALVGHTGSGKSTLASLLMGFYPVKEGEVTLDGRALSSLAQPVLRQGVAMVQQDPHVLNDTVRENICLGRQVTDDAIWQALENVGLAAQIRHYKAQLDTRLGGGEVNLSAGQKQLLALARVLVAKPKVLILDEATANIDSGTEQNIQRGLALLRKDMSIVVIAHRLSTIMDADEIIVLNRGEIIERGTHKNLLAQQGHYLQMYQLQQAGELLQQLESDEGYQDAESKPHDIQTQESA
ncbi:multidrug ABC transporter permease/ATP-binding protein [Photobacterium jeanii]|uniref:Multidrug ABC transporter permease/ATP-binding protein n=1 Tax=Photobacterium jeanii TaxID=858640 RepID=A0A178KNK3_9GAMM|nr:SmdB family multidrug efflux ABC transporter permease/ATP-binding protein [Photobacterium jeanii]OAN18555.1 multidrug ABC transporter permease/ATP-binding protein [Photobacterium jeanii]PST91763.1 multidrug ABC transporter permease/ATP-binding protein [Photobacterium jeanii]